MAHPTRGQTSHTYDIVEVVNIDYANLALVYRDAAHALPQRVQFRIDDQTAAARQVFQGIVDSLALVGDGQWESSYTLGPRMGVLAKLVEVFHADGIDDFSSTSVGLTELRNAIEKFDSGSKRSLNKLMGRVLQTCHPNGQVLAKALRNTSYMVKPARIDLYEDAEVKAIEHAARRVFDAAFKAQRDIFKTLGYEVGGREWLRIPAHEVLDSIRLRFPSLRQVDHLPLNTPFVEQAAWVLMHPERFPHKGGRKGGAVRDERLASLSLALYPSRTTLVAAAILHCLCDLSGLNLSVILRTEPADLVHTGNSTGVVSLAKARNHSEDRLAVRTESNNTLGGLIEALTGLTRFAREYRVNYFRSAGRQIPIVTNRLYVEHTSDPSQAKIIPDSTLHHGWRNQIFDNHWPDDKVARSSVGLRFNALRRKALERAINEDPKGDVHGHTSRTRLYYLQNVLPNHTLVQYAVAAQDNIAGTALERFTSVTESTDPAVRELALAVSSGETADLLASVCVSGGQDPQSEALPCSLGLAACFTCPNGYRTVDHIPGLLALEAYTELIGSNDPDEWEHGDAGILNFYAKQSLEQFSRTVVNQVRTGTDLRGEMAVIHGLYTEFRR